MKNPDWKKTQQCKYYGNIEILEQNQNLGVIKEKKKTEIIELKFKVRKN